MAPHWGVSIGSPPSSKLFGSTQLQMPEGGATELAAQSFATDCPHLGQRLCKVCFAVLGRHRHIRTRPAEGSVENHPARIAECPVQESWL